MSFSLRGLRRSAIARNLSSLHGKVAWRIISSLGLDSEEARQVLDYLAYVWVEGSCDNQALSIPTSKLDWFEELKNESVDFIWLQLELHDLDPNEIALIKTAILYRLNIINPDEGDDEIEELGLLLMMLIADRS